MCHPSAVPVVGAPGPPGTSKTDSVLAVPSPQSALATKSSTVPAAGWSKPGSENGKENAITAPSSVAASAPASTVGATLLTWTVVVYSTEPPSSSATIRRTVYVPSSPYVKDEALLAENGYVPFGDSAWSGPTPSLYAAWSPHETSSSSVTSRGCTCGLGSGSGYAAGSFG